ncbi:hypothetical protein AsFcp4_222 [Aeromonas phage AsFcp_4]|uniref:Uncharacterized protein n=1 Tax=Aeromonas phage PX29 TaxID=926067 RepID=E5DPZ7_9CAUD|nr:hypothetical protein CL89_gp064 [Aeromonas phage PX29]ADQ52783.1 hypothetical protein PX29p064 [Aeromonas phage PX29]QAX98643.1 hypothetical protein ASfcp2_310 [Aeromonas phage AsFcp_2]QAX99675.1 hypothetical protein AsFcp4_222 [Aeromonas phage AsFcp_4]
MFEFIKERKCEKLIAFFKMLGYNGYRSIAFPGNSVYIRMPVSKMLVVYPKIFGYTVYYYNDVTDNLEPTIFEDADLEFIESIINSIKSYEE